MQLSALVLDKRGHVLVGEPVTWTSSKPQIATVGGSTGLVTGVEGGQPVIITAQLGGLTDSVTFTVAHGPPDFLEVVPDEASIEVGGRVLFIVRVFDAMRHEISPPSVSWSSSNTSVATVAKDSGLASGLSGGSSVTILAQGSGLTGSASLTVETICVPTLVSPRDGAVLDNGTTDRADDIIWDFEWSSCEGATLYQLYVIHSGASNPLINVTVSSSSYRFVSSGSYIIDSNRRNWTWKVSAQISGQWNEWSEVRTFDVEPVNTDSPICVPTLVSPPDGAVLDNGTTDRADDIIWDFEWSSCEVLPYTNYM